MANFHTQHVNKWLNEQMDNNTAQWPGHHAMYSIRLTPFNYGITPSAVFTWLAWSLSDFGHDHGYVMHQLNRGQSLFFQRLLL